MRTPVRHPWDDITSGRPLHRAEFIRRSRDLYHASQWQSNWATDSDTWRELSRRQSFFRGNQAFFKGAHFSILNT